MRVVVSNPASDLIEENGGRVYVWPKRSRCCGALTTLATSNEPPRRREFVQVETTEQFELYRDARLPRLPDELHLDLRRFPRRVEAYWNDCAWSCEAEPAGDRARGRRTNAGAASTPRPYPPASPELV
jgi:hypothetical protein